MIATGSVGRVLARLSVLMAVWPTAVLARDDLLARIESLERSIAAIGQRVKSVAQVQGVPAGTVIAYAGQSIPPGWLVADGRWLKRSDFPKLYEAIEATYGHREEARQFRLPDLRGYFVRGYGRVKSRDSNKDRQFGSYQDSGVERHSHDVSGTGHTSDADRPSYRETAGGRFALSNFVHALDGVTLIFHRYALYPGSKVKPERDGFDDHTHAVHINADAEAYGFDESVPHNIALYYVIKY